MTYPNTLYKTLLLSLIFGYSLSLQSCRQTSEEIAEKAIEKNIESSTGEKVDIEYSNKGEEISIKTAEGEMVINKKSNTWPSDIPSDVPQLIKAKIASVTTSNTSEGNSWNIIYEGNQLGQLDAVSKQLKAAGYETVTMSMGEGGSVMGENSKMAVVCIFSKENVMMTVSEKK